MFTWYATMKRFINYNGAYVYIYRRSEFMTYYMGLDLNKMGYGAVDNYVFDNAIRDGKIEIMPA